MLPRLSASDRPDREGGLISWSAHSPLLPSRVYRERNCGYLSCRSWRVEALGVTVGFRPVESINGEVVVTSLLTFLPCLLLLSPSDLLCVLLTLLPISVLSNPLNNNNIKLFSLIFFCCFFFKRTSHWQAILPTSYCLISPLLQEST